MEQKGNSLKGRLAFACISPFSPVAKRPSIEGSPEYVICSAVKFKVVLNVFTTSDPSYHLPTMVQKIYIRVVKCLRTDPLNYTILFSSEKLDVRRAITIDDHESMEVLIKEIEERIESTFDIDVRLDISRGTEAFKCLYKDTDLTDFELHGEDGSVRVHKLILANHSPVLKTMLSGEWKEVTAGAIEVPKITKETLQHLKDYMYLQKIPEDSEVERLAELASFYMMSDLKQRCTFLILSHLKPENTFQFLALALKLNMKRLFIAILDNIKRGVIKVEDIDRCCALEEMEEQMDDDQEKP